MWESGLSSQEHHSHEELGLSHGEGGGDWGKGKYWELANGKLSFPPVKYSGCMAVISYCLIKSLMLPRTR